MPRDATSPVHEAAGHGSADQRLDPAYYCAACGQLVTRPAWAIAVNDSHDHVVFNPAGLVFRVVCFHDAPGVVASGPLSHQFSWFRPHGWRIGLCRACGVHLGWRYESEAAEPRLFFGLIRTALTLSGP